MVADSKTDMWRLVALAHTPLAETDDAHTHSHLSPMCVTALVSVIELLPRNPQKVFAAKAKPQQNKTDAKGMPK